MEWNLTDEEKKRASIMFDSPFLAFLTPNEIALNEIAVQELKIDYGRFSIVVGSFEKYVEFHLQIPDLDDQMKIVIHNKAGILKKEIFAEPIKSKYDELIEHYSGIEKMMIEADEQDLIY